MRPHKDAHFISAGFGSGAKHLNPVAHQCCVLEVFVSGM